MSQPLKKLKECFLNKGSQWHSRVKAPDTRGLRSVYYFFFEGNLIFSPSTTKFPLPQWWIMRCLFLEVVIQALRTSKINRQYFETIFVSTTLHSRLAKHSPIIGALTNDGGSAVRRNCLILSTLAPVVFPTPTTVQASSTSGILITHSFVFFMMSKVKFWSLITQPISGFSNSIIICQDIVMIFDFPWWAVETMTTGPGSSNW